MVAHPVPPGATVIAKPIIPGLPGQQNMPVPVPYQMMPEQLKQSFAPKMMVWTNHHPEGQLVPLRQPDPAVYFPTKRSKLTKNNKLMHVESHSQNQNDQKRDFI